MATKPVVSFTFATNANYTSGPQTGNPTKVVPGDLLNGMIPGLGIPAAWHNYIWNISGQWSVWLLAGSDAPDLDAHLVETDASGYGSLAQLTLGGTPSALQSLVVTQNTGAQSSSIYADNTGTGSAMVGFALAAVATIKGTNTGTGPGVEGLATGTNNVGVKGTGDGTAAGGQFVGGLTGAGVEATGGATGADGLVATGTGVGTYGVDATCGASGAGGMRGVGGSTSAPGVQGDTAAAATTSASGVLGNALGNGTGVFGLAVDGYGVVARCDTSSPIRAPLRIEPQNADPTTPAMGDLTHRSDIDIPRVYTDSLWQSPWTTASGHTHGLAAPRVTVATNGDNTTYVTLVSVALASPYEPRFAGGQILFFASARFGDADATNHHYEIDVQILDLTAGVAVFETTFWTGPADDESIVDGKAISQWTMSVPYTVPAAGARQFALRFKPTDNTGFDAVADMASLNVIGVFG